MKTLLVIGASSDIAQATARKYATNGYRIILTGRNIEALEAFSEDLRIRYEAEAEVYKLDVLDLESHINFYNSLPHRPDGVIVAAGYLGEQSTAQNDESEAQKIIQTNFNGVVSILNIIANDFETRANGFIIGISSVAGDRGRKSNYIYGAAKAGLSAYLSGLRNRLYSSNVQVLTVKPGFVDTKMTHGLDLPEALTAQPNEVADDIYKAQQKRKDIIYTKGLWKVIMLIIVSIPEFVFKRLNL